MVSTTVLAIAGEDWLDVGHWVWLHPVTGRAHPMDSDDLGKYECVGIVVGRVFDKVRIQTSGTIQIGGTFNGMP